jgi:hypothetical protein
MGVAYAGSMVAGSSIEYQEVEIGHRFIVPVHGGTVSKTVNASDTVLFRPNVHGVLPVT